MNTLQNSKLFSGGKKVGIEALKTETTKKKPHNSYTSPPALPPSPALIGGADTSHEQRKRDVTEAPGAPVFSARSSSGTQCSRGRVGRGSETAGVGEQGCYTSLSN